MIGHVQRFWELHGESRFDSLDDPPKNAFTGQEIKEKPSAQRAGYREGEGDDRRWYVFPQVWRDEICAGSTPARSRACSLASKSWKKETANT